MNWPLRLGFQKMNLHGLTRIDKARKPTPGSADFCRISRIPLAELRSDGEACGIGGNGGEWRSLSEPKPFYSRVACRDKGRSFDAAHPERAGRSADGPRGRA